MATIGQSIVFKGELTGDEDLEIDGQVDGDVNLTNHALTIGANGRLKAEVNAKTIIVIGQVKGNLTATERIDLFRLRPPDEVEPHTEFTWCQAPGGAYRLVLPRGESVEIRQNLLDRWEVRLSSPSLVGKVLQWGIHDSLKQALHDEAVSFFAHILRRRWLMW